MDSRKVAAIIQARMGSTRFPGKVLLPLAGKPVLWHVIHRLKKSGTVSETAVATSANPVDDPILEFCREQGVPCIRGSEDNVLERYLQAARELDADIIVRVTGDAPLADPAIIDRLVRRLIREGADYCTGDPGAPTIHEGFSPFTRKALERLGREAADDPVAVEHVTAYFKQHPEKFKTALVRLPEEHEFTGARVSVDTPADLEFLEAVYRRLSVPAGEADAADVVGLLKSDPGLLGINSKVRQKGAAERTRRALVRCDGDEQIGLGHVVRCLALAEELRERHAMGVRFAVSRGPKGVQMIRENGFPLETRPENIPEGAWIDGLVGKTGIDSIVIDIRTDLDGKWIRKWRESGILAAVIDDPSPRRLEADLAFYPPVPDLEKMGWNGFEGRLFAGWEWVILRRQFSGPPPPREAGAQNPPTILVTMGGSDPEGMTVKAMEALDGLEGAFNPVVVVGSAFSRQKELEGLLKRVRRPFDVRRDVRDMAELMSQADLAVASFGVTAYELAAMGVPAAYLSLTEDHFRHAGVFADAGIALNLGLHHCVEPSAIREKVSELLSDRTRLKAMGLRTKGLVDGKGAERIAKIISDRSGQNHA